MPDQADLQNLLDQAVVQGVAPAMVLLLWQDGQPLHHLAAGQAQTNTIFDLASLTKPLAAAPLALELARQEILDWDAPLGDLWGGAVPQDKQDITVGQLLTHAAGYPAYQPYFQALEKQPPSQRKGLLKAMLMNEPLAAEPGSRAAYSDLGYMLLGLLLEQGFGTSLDEALNGLYANLKIEGPRYLPLGQPLPWPREEIAPCGSLPGREHIQGQVEDENCFALGGVAAHAGLLGNALQVAQVMQALCDNDWGAPLFQVDGDTPGSGRTPGFDTPNGEASAAGPNAPPGTVGHLGFTGCSLWWHLASGRGVVLLSNRVALGRDNEKIKPFRRQVHEAAWRVLGE